MSFITRLKDNLAMLKRKKETEKISNLFDRFIAECYSPIITDFGSADYVEKRVLIYFLDDACKEPAQYCPDDGVYYISLGHFGYDHGSDFANSLIKKFKDFCIKYEFKFDKKGMGGSYGDMLFHHSVAYYMTINGPIDKLRAAINGGSVPVVRPTDTATTNGIAPSPRYGGNSDTVSRPHR